MAVQRQKVTSVGPTAGTSGAVLSGPKASSSMLVSSWVVYESGMMRGSVPRSSTARTSSTMICHQRRRRSSASYGGKDKPDPSRCRFSAWARRSTRERRAHDVRPLSSVRRHAWGKD